MRKILLVAPVRNSDAQEAAHRIAELMQKQDVTVMTPADSFCRMEGLPLLGNEKPDAVISIGGDGTLLRAASYAVRRDAPLLGINMGRLGFLTETEKSDAGDAVSRLLAGDYTIENRALLEVDHGQSRYLVMNDVVVSRGGYARLIRIKTMVDGETVGEYLADGVIVATPTGSTGYSLSAGGPIISPAVDCTVITPVCAHSLQHRPVVVCPDSEISLQFVCDEGATASLEVDGQNCEHLTGEHTIRIHRAPERVRLIRLGKQHFFDTVRHKLVEWSC